MAMQLGRTPEEKIMQRFNQDVERVFACDDCDKRWREDELKPAQDLTQRVDLGGPMPSGECPVCGALCYKLQTKRMVTVGTRAK